MKKFKKTLLMALSFALVAVVSVASTLAYLSAQDNAASVFTAGQVDIELIEQQRNADRTALEDFKQGKELLPIVGSAQGEKDKFGLPTAANYVDKIVTVKNTGRNDAWVRVLVGFPVALDHADASKMPLHWNIGTYFDAEGNYNGDGVEAPYNWNVDILDYVVEVNGINYNVYSFTYKTTLANGETTPDPAIVGLYLDSRVNYDADLNAYTIDYGNGPEVITNFDGNVVMPVVAQAVQAGGFATGEDAFEAAFPVNAENVKTWLDGNTVEIAKPEANAVRPAGYVVTGENAVVDGLTVIDGSDANTNLRAIYNGEKASDYVKGNLTIKNSYLDGTYAMNVYGDKTGDLVVIDTALRGWVSYSGFKTATFTNCTFGQNTNPEYYNTIRPYSTITFVNCDFDGTAFWFDMLPADATVTFENCTMNGNVIDSVDDLNIVKTTTNTITIK